MNIKLIDLEMKQLFNDLFGRSNYTCFTVTSTRKSFQTIELRGTSFYSRNWNDYYLNHKNFN